MVREIFDCGIQGAEYTSMPANTSEKATEDEYNQAQRAQILPPANSRVEDAAYSRITRQEEDECGD
jgi:hypothetical protein